MNAPDRDRRRSLRRAYKEAGRDLIRQSLPIDETQLTELVSYVDSALEPRGCDHTPSAAHEWAQSNGIDWDELAPALAENGGFCDCEIVMNCDPRQLFG